MDGQEVEQLFQFDDTKDLQAAFESCTSAGVYAVAQLLGAG